MTKKRQATILEHVPQEPQYENIIDSLDRTFQNRRKIKRRAKTLEKLTPVQQAKKVEEHVKREKNLELEKKQSTKLIRDLQKNYTILLTNKKTINGKFKFNSQVLQRHLNNFLTYRRKEGYLVIEKDQFIRIDETE